MGVELGYIIATLISLAAYTVVCIALLILSYTLLDLLTPGKLTQIIKNGGWNASLLAAANMVAVALIIMFAMLGQPVSVGGIITATVFAVAGAIGQACGLWLTRKLWFAKTNFEELLASKISPAGVFVAATSLALGISIAVAVH